MVDLVVEKMVLLPTQRLVNGVPIRNFELSMTVDGLETLTNQLSEAGVGNGSAVSPGTINGIVGLNGRPIRDATIPHGWDTQRLKFILIVHNVTNGTTYTHYIQGYSEYYEKSLSGVIDDNMPFIINSILTTATIRNPMTNMPNTTVFSNYNVITGDAGNTVFENVDTGSSLELVRPVDIINGISMDVQFGGNNNQRVIDKTSTVGTSPMTTNRKHNDAGAYFTGLVNACTEGLNVNAGTNDPTAYLQSAMHQLRPDKLVDNAFISKLMAVTGVIAPTTFTLNTLRLSCVFNPDVIVLVNNGELHNSAFSFVQASGVESMTSARPETGLVTAIVNGLASTMSDNLITALDVSFTNVSGVPVIVPGIPQSLVTGIDVTPKLNNVISYIRQLLMPTITYNNQQFVEVNASVDIIGETVINISLNGAPHIVYRMPTYADSTYSPTLSTSEGKEVIVSNTSAILDVVHNARGHN